MCQRNFTITRAHPATDAMLPRGRMLRPCHDRRVCLGA